MKNKVAIGVKWTTLDVVLSNLTNFLLMIFLARLLDPKDFGLLAMIAIFTAFSEAIINSGFSQALIQRNKKSDLDDYNTVFTINIILSIIVYMLLCFFSEKIANFYNSPELILIIKVYFLCLILSSISIVPQAILSINLDFARLSIVNVIATIVSALVAVLLAINGFGYWSLVSVTLVKWTVISLVHLTISEWKPALYIKVKSFKILFRYGSKLLLASLINVLTNNIHAMIIGRYFNGTTLGYYSQSNNLSSLLSKNIVVIFQKVSFPYLSSINEDKDKSSSAFKQLISVSMLISLPVLVGLASVSYEFVMVILGNKWLPIVNILTFLCLAKSITPIGSLNINAISAIGRSDVVLKIDFFKLPITVGVILVTIPYGIEIVAIGQIFLSVSYFIMNSYYSKEYLNFGFLEQIKCMYKYIIAAVLMFVVNTSFYLDNDVAGLIVKIFLGAVVYILVCFILKVEMIRLKKFKT